MMQALGSVLVVLAPLAGPPPAPFATPAGPPGPVVQQLEKDRVSSLESGAVRELQLARPAGTRVEHFRLDLHEGSAVPVGVVRWVSGPDPEAHSAGHDGQRFETETSFFDVGTRVLQFERVRYEKQSRCAPDEPVKQQTLVWREMRSRSGRTVLVEGTRGEPLRSADTVGGEVVRRVHRGSEARLPLSLIEAVRGGEIVQGSVPVFHPLSCSVEDLLAETRIDESGGRRERILELRRPNGDGAGRYAFESGSLTAFRLQDGGAQARRITREEYERLIAENHERAPAGAAGYVVADR